MLTNLDQCFSVILGVVLGYALAIATKGIEGSPVIATSLFFAGGISTIGKTLLRLERTGQTKDDVDR